MAPPPGHQPRTGASTTQASSGIPGRRGRPWDEQAIRDALTEFLAGRDAWPTYDEFLRGGAKGLRDAIGRIRGAEWWAREMGLQGGERRRGGVRRWTDETIADTLAAFVGDCSTWPTRSEFRAAGLRGLREALRDHGGVQRWATEMGVDLPPSRKPPPAPDRSEKPPPRRTPAREWPLWNERRIQSELSAFLGGRQEWPRHREFVAAGHQQLYHAVITHGGSQAWARRMGVRWVRRPSGSPEWTEQRIRDRLTELVRGRASWPSVQEFAQAGEQGLLRAVRRHGGTDRWRRELGLASHGARLAAGRRIGGASRSPATSRLWTDARIAAAITPLVRELGRWPTKGEFRRAGLGRALAAVYGHGGRELWQRRLGVAPREHSGPVPDRTRWTREKIETELRELCCGRQEWPSYGEFDRAGAKSLYLAAARHGGMAGWRARLGYG